MNDAPGKHSADEGSQLDSQGEKLVWHLDGSGTLWMVVGRTGPGPGQSQAWQVAQCLCQSPGGTASSAAVLPVVSVSPPVFSSPSQSGNTAGPSPLS